MVEVNFLEQVNGLNNEKQLSSFKNRFDFIYGIVAVAKMYLSQSQFYVAKKYTYILFRQ
mgnify:CR=1 FL=1